MVPEITQGDTADWILPLLDENEDPLDLSSLLGYAVFLYDDKDKIIIKYSKNELSGFTNTLTQDVSAVNNIRMINEASHTKLWKGEIFYRIKAQATDSDYENDRWTGSTEKKLLMTVKEDQSGQYSVL